MRQVGIVLWVVLVVFAVVGCGRQSTTSVNELLDSGSKYNGQTVTVQGKVSLTISGVLNMIRLEDSKDPSAVKWVTASIQSGSLDQLGIKDGDTVCVSGKYDSENHAVECSTSDVKKI